MRSRAVRIVCAFAMLALAATGVSEAWSGVQTSTGDYAYRFTDATFVVGDAQFEFARAYKSLNTRTKAPLGPGWTHTFNMRLNTPGDSSGDLIVTSRTGGTTRLAPAGNNIYTPTRGAAQGTLRLVTDAVGAISSVLTDTEGEFSFDWTGHLIDYTELGKPKLTIRQDHTELRRRRP